MDVYKVYIKIFNKYGLPEIVAASRTVTPEPRAAEAAFRALIGRQDLVGKNVHVVLSFGRRHLMYHRFDRMPGQADYVAPDAPITLYHDSGQ